MKNHYYLKDPLDEVPSLRGQLVKVLYNFTPGQIGIILHAYNSPYFGMHAECLIGCKKNLLIRGEFEILFFADDND